jgi:hypothetical protein
MVKEAVLSGWNGERERERVLSGWNGVRKTVFIAVWKSASIAAAK